MLTKTNLKAIRLADEFVFMSDNGKSLIRCIKKGSAQEDEPFAQPDVHHDIQCEAEYTGNGESAQIVIETANDAVVATVLNSLKDADEIKLSWMPLTEADDRFMLSLHIERKGKALQYILAVQDQTAALRAVA